MREYVILAPYHSSSCETLADFLAAFSRPFGGTGREFEPNFCGGGIKREVRVELAFGAVGDETFEKISFSFGDEFDGLVFWNFALEDCFPDADAGAGLFW